MRYRWLRALRILLLIVGWFNVVSWAAAGCAVWYLDTIEPMPLQYPWRPLVAYSSPIIGLVTGIILGAIFFIIAEVIRLLLDHRDTADRILDGIRQLVHLQQGGPEKHDDPPTDVIDAPYDGKRL